jgi:hypothetical protein
MRLTIAPIDAAILSLVQLLQPVTAAELLQEADKTIVAHVVNDLQMQKHLERLEADRFLFRTADGLFVVAPKSYELISRSIDAKRRDKARLLLLNKRRYT